MSGNSGPRLKTLAKRIGAVLLALNLGGGAVAAFFIKDYLPLLIGAILGLLSCWAAVFVYTLGQLEEDACLIKKMGRDKKPGGRDRGG